MVARVCWVFQRVACVLACMLLGFPRLLQAAEPSGKMSRHHVAAEANPANVRGGVFAVVNQGLIVTGSVLYRDITVPNLCVELRGYEAGHVPEDGPSGDSGSTTDAVAGKRSWRWADGEMPRSIQLQRTDSKDGSFAFVTPESDLVLVLAVYSHGGDYPSAIRPFPDRGGYDVGKREGVQETLGFGSGRLEMHVRLAGRLESPEVLWDRPARENDHSPCARKEATSTATFATKGTPTSPSLAAAPLSLLLGRGQRATTGTEQRSRQDINDRLPSEACTTHPSASGCNDDLNQAATARVTLTLLLQSSCWNYGQHGAGLWDITGVCEVFHSALETDYALKCPSLRPLNAIWMVLSEPYVRESAAWWAIRVAVGFGSLALCTLCACHKGDGLQTTPSGAKSAVGQRSPGDHTENPAGRSSVPMIIGTTRSPNGSISQTGMPVPHQLDEPKASTSSSGSNTRKFWGSARKGEMKTAQREKIDEFSSMFIALGGPASVRGQDAKGSSCLGHVVVTN